MSVVNGLRQVALHAGELSAIVVPEAAMVVTALRHRGEDLLAPRRGLDAYLDRGVPLGIPLLHPWANRLSRAAFDLDGRRVDAGGALQVGGLPIHGLMPWTRAWRITEETDRAVTARLDWKDDARAMAAFPFDHRVTVRHALDERGLRVTTRVEGDVRVAPGWHPFLRLPGEPRADWRVVVPADSIVPLDERGLPAGPAEPLAPLDGPLGTRTLDALVTGIRDAPFVLEGERRRIAVTVEHGARYAQVFAPGNDDVVSFEPMAAPTDALVRGRELPRAPLELRFAIHVEHRLP